MPMTTAGKNTAINAIASSITHLAAFNGNPASGGVEISGGTYARQAVTFNAAADGSATIASNPSFNFPAGSTVTFLAGFTALTGGTLVAYRTVTSQTFSTDGAGQVQTFTLNSGDLA